MINEKFSAKVLLESKSLRSEQNQKFMSIDVLKKIALLLKNPDEVHEHLIISANNNLNHAYLLSLSKGYPGLLLLFSTLDELYPEEGWEVISHQYVMKIKEIIETKGISDFSLFNGLSGSCMAIQHASRNKSRYQNLLKNLNIYLFKKIHDVYLVHLNEKIDLNLPVLPSLYDLETGISGIGTYALTNVDCSLTRASLNEILKICIALTKDITFGTNTFPGWYIPNLYQFVETDKTFYPKGNFNLGFAKGVTGILAFLSLAAIKGIVLEGQMEAIYKVSNWIYSKKREENETYFWLNRISFEEEIQNQKREEFDSRMEAWSYGTPGIARTLFLAGTALKDPHMKKNASNAFGAIFKQNQLKSKFSKKTLCDGLAGVLVMTELMARDTKSQGFKSQTYPIGEMLFQHYIQESQMLKNTVDIGLLNGSTGVLLALISHYTGSFSWTSPLLIEGN